MKTPAEWGRVYLDIKADPSRMSIMEFIAAIQADALEAAAKVVDDWNGNGEENPNRKPATGHMIRALIPKPEGER
jgi:hypothetical protein